jgi:serine/threonine-protein kinase RsbW
MIARSLTVHADDGAMRELEAFVEAFATAQELGAADKARTLIVIEELLTNLVQYGYASKTDPAREVEVTLELTDNQFTVEFIDDGIEFDPISKAVPDLEQLLSSRHVGGLGLQLVREIPEEIHYCRRDTRNVIRLMWRVSR